MIYLFILFFNTNFALSNELLKIIHMKIIILKKYNPKLHKTNYSLLAGQVLKDIPKTKVSDSEKKELRSRNPFSPLGSESLNSKSGINFSDISFKGIAKIGENKVVFMQTAKGIKSYKLNQNIGGGYKISNINEKDLLVEISNQSATHTLKLEKDEK